MRCPRVQWWLTTPGAQCHVHAFALSMRQFEVGMLSAAREHGTRAREHEYGTYGTRAHGTCAVAEFDVAPLRTCGLIRAKGPAVFLAQPEGLGTRCDEQLRAKGPAVCPHQRPSSKRSPKKSSRPGSLRIFLRVVWLSYSTRRNSISRSWSTIT